MTMPEPTHPGHACPACGSENRKVISSRRTGGRLRRRCHCLVCGPDVRWSTVEVAADYLERLEAQAAPSMPAAIQTSRLIDLVDRFRDDLVESLPAPAHPHLMR